MPFTRLPRQASVIQCPGALICIDCKGIMIFTVEYSGSGLIQETRDCRCSVIGAGGAVVDVLARSVACYLVGSMAAGHMKPKCKFFSTKGHLSPFFPHEAVFCAIAGDRCAV